jgi:hypothetical protein
MLLRIFIGNTDKRDGKLLSDVIVLKARELGLAGATALQGFMGFGAHSRVHKVRALQLSDDLPVVIEIVDTQEKLDTLLPWLEQVVHVGMVTLEEVKVLHYRPGTA